MMDGCVTAPLEARQDYDVRKKITKLLYDLQY